MPSASTKPVFISYARQSSAAHAKALHQALGAESFLDERGIDLGEPFPEVIADTLLGSRVVVVFADEAYFQRPYCLWELQAALGLAALGGESAPRLDGNSLEHVVVALPADEDRSAELDRLPPALASGSWPRASETTRIAEMVRARLAARGSSVGQRYVDAGQTVESVKRWLLGLAANPPPLSLAGVRTYPKALPQPLKTFVGRSADLTRVDLALSTFGGGPAGAAQAVSIEAGAGFGKSTLAREYLHRLAPKRFPGGLFWINADEALDAQFHGILQALSPTVPDLSEFQQQRRDARKELEAALDKEAAKEPKAPILWVVDNIPEDGQSLREYCPALGKVSVLTTSRRRLSIRDQTVSPLPIGVLDAPSAAELLVAGLSPKPPLRDSEVVAKWVGRLPVALVVLNASLRTKRWTLDELVRAAQGAAGTTKHLDEEWNAWAKRGFEGLPAGVHQAFGLSYERLSPEAQEGARLVSQLAPSPIPVQLIAHLKLSRDVCGDLVDFSFVGKGESAPRDAESELPMFGTMHRVLADYLRGRATDATAEAIRAVEAVTTTLNDALRARDQWRVLLYCAPHAQHLFELTHPTAPALQMPIEVRTPLATALSSAFAELGRREEALATVQEAVGVLRPLAKARPEAFEPYLAGSLNNLSGCLGDLGRREDALDAIQQAVDIRRRLAKAAPEAFEPNLSASLNNLSGCLGNLGRREDALDAIQQAMDIRRRLAKARPEAFEPDLAESLHNLSNRLGDLGRREDALAAIEAGVEIRRRLVKARPDAFEPDLAMSLNNLSWCLSDLGRCEDALAAIQNAVDIYRRLAKARPNAFAPYLAGSLNNLSEYLGKLERWKEALVIVEEAIGIFRRCTHAAPGAFEPYHAEALNGLSVCLGELGRREEALAAVEKALAIRRPLARAMPDAFEPGLAISLDVLSTHLSGLGRREEALAASEGAVEIQRKLAKATPGAFEPALEKSLKHLSLHLNELGRQEEASAADREAAEIRARLEQKRGPA